jgi:hypothetical protein
MSWKGEQEWRKVYSLSYSRFGGGMEAECNSGWGDGSPAGSIGKVIVLCRSI